MVWRTLSVDQQRLTFIHEALNPSTRLSFLELCEKYGISRKTGYKWLYRFTANGESGLQDLSRARHTQSTKISNEVALEIARLRLTFVHCVPKKIRAKME